MERRKRVLNILMGKFTSQSLKLFHEAGRTSEQFDKTFQDNQDDQPFGKAIIEGLPLGGRKPMNQPVRGDGFDGCQYTDHDHAAGIPGGDDPLQEINGHDGKTNHHAEDDRIAGINGEILPAGGRTQRLPLFPPPDIQAFFIGEGVNGETELFGLLAGQLDIGSMTGNHEGHILTPALNLEELIKEGVVNLTSDDHNGGAPGQVGCFLAEQACDRLRFGALDTSKGIEDADELAAALAGKDGAGPCGW